MIPHSTPFRSTYAFRVFRKKHDSLSRMYWLTQLGNESVKKQITTANENTYIADTIGTSFKRAMLPETGKEYLEKITEREGIQRLHLLIIASANLETYLKSSILLFVGELGHAQPNYELDVVGEAIAKPVIKSSTVPLMLKYIESLIDVEFKHLFDSWQLAYKLRCAAAHNGGIVDARTKNDLPKFKFKVGDLIQISWPTLMEYLSAADDIACIIDRKISTPPLRNLEVRWILEEMKQNKSLPAKKIVWQILHKDYGVAVTRANKLLVEKFVY